MHITADSLFIIVNSMAVIGWLLLIGLPRHMLTQRIVSSGFLSATLAVLYAIVVIWQLPNSEGGFGSLAKVGILYANPYLLLAGWLHYLAFDLLVGVWAVNAAQQRGIPHLWVVPSLVLMFLLGPAGFLVFLATRAGFKKRLA